MKVKLKVRRKDWLDHQWEFLTAEEKIVGLVAGFGAGKTYVFLRRTLLAHLFKKNPKTGKSNGKVIYPTFALAEELFVEPFKELLEKFHIAYSYNSSKHIFVTVYGAIQIYQLVNPERIVGSELTYIGFDEFDIASWKNCKTAFEKGLGRLRGSEDAIMYFVSTPEGLHYLYKIFVTDKDESRRLIQADTRSNPFLPPGYIALLKTSYTEKLLEAYMQGKFVNLTAGSLYYNFDREIHCTKETENETMPLFLSCDFNKAPMAWVVAQQKPSINGSILHFVAGIDILSGATTKQAAEVFCDRFKNHKNKQVFVTGDASGTVTNTKDFTTDYIIIVETLKAEGWQVVLDIPKSNPGINNRINITTTLIHQGRLKIHKSMIHLIRDYENVVGDGHGAKNKDNDELTHSSDAADYLVNKLYAKEFFNQKMRQL